MHGAAIPILDSGKYNVAVVLEGYDIVDGDPCNHTFQVRDLETQGDSEALWSNGEVGGRGA